MFLVALSEYDQVLVESDNEVSLSRISTKHFFELDVQKRICRHLDLLPLFNVALLNFGPFNLLKWICWFSSDRFLCLTLQRLQRTFEK